MPRTLVQRHDRVYVISLRPGESQQVWWGKGKIYARRLYPDNLTKHVTAAWTGITCTTGEEGHFQVYLTP